MTTILTIFCLSLILSLVLTPLAGRLGTKFGAMDEPSERKVYSKLIPRIGGLAIFLSFILTLMVSSLFPTSVTELLVLKKQMVFFLGGAVICFVVGIFDDFRKLRARATITSHFYISASAHLWLIPQSQNPRNSQLFLWFCSLGSAKPEPNLSANSAKLFLREP